MARSFLAQLQRNLYLAQRITGDARAIQNGTYVKRRVRRVVRRNLLRRWSRTGL